MSIRTITKTFLTLALLLSLAFIALFLSGRWDPEPRSAGQDRLSAEVISIYDGDTMRVNLSGKESVSLRVLGIDAPELARDGQDAQCGGYQARDALRELAPVGSIVTLRYDTRADRTDRYQRHLAHVTLPDGRDVGQTLVQEGLVAAWYPSSEPEPDGFGQLRDLQDAAQRSAKGSWDTCESLGR